MALAQIYATAGRDIEARKLLDDIRDNYSIGENDFRGMGQVYAALGDIDLAFE